mmetsp:Transcript_24688/g.76121  ORF Transcript_24688/g.76121 Transcript_24688/m.76121 type:complete len:237 (-) Transcript_24688:160-870(-)
MMSAVSFGKKRSCAWRSASKKGMASALWPSSTSAVPISRSALCRQPSSTGRPRYARQHSHPRANRTGPAKRCKQRRHFCQSLNSVAPGRPLSCAPACLDTTSARPRRCRGTRTRVPTLALPTSRRSTSRRRHRPRTRPRRPSRSTRPSCQPSSRSSRAACGLASRSPGTQRAIGDRLAPRAALHAALLGETGAQTGGLTWTDILPPRVKFARATIYARRPRPVRSRMPALATSKAL